MAVTDVRERRKEGCLSETGPCKPASQPWQPFRLNALGIKYERKKDLRKGGKASGQGSRGWKAAWNHDHQRSKVSKLLVQQLID
jgi:hypothetical protein